MELFVRSGCVGCSRTLVVPDGCTRVLCVDGGCCICFAFVLASSFLFCLVCRLPGRSRVGLFYAVLDSIVVFTFARVSSRRGRIYFMVTCSQCSDLIDVHVCFLGVVIVLVVDSGL